MKIRVSELTGAKLDFLVFLADEGEDKVDWGYFFAWDKQNDDRKSYSTNWAHGGPIIERERIELSYDFKNHTTPNPCFAKLVRKDPNYSALQNMHFYSGPTPLIAAMRAYVASVYGEEVDDEN